MSALLDPAGFDRMRRRRVDRGWAVQVFALSADSVPAALAMIELALLDEEHQVAQAGDDHDAYLIVETRDDVTVKDAVRVAVATADSSASLEHVSGTDGDSLAGAAG